MVTLPFLTAVCRTHPAQSITHAGPFTDFLLTSERKETASLRSVWLRTLPQRPEQTTVGQEPASAKFKGENQHQLFTGAEKVRENRRMSKVGTLQESEAIFPNVPPKTKGESHTERLRVRGGG